VSGVDGPVVSARLRVYATSATADGPAVFAAGNGWAETGLTWAGRPERASAPLDDVGAVAGGTWVEYDVTAAVTGDGDYTFALVGTSSDGVQFRARESTLAPQLVLKIGPPPVRTFSPERDARVEQAFPDVNYPTGPLRIDGGLDPAAESYLAFAVRGLQRPVKSARLRLYAISATADGPAVFEAGNDWTETGLTWAARPERGSAPLDDAGPVSADAWVEYDVSAAVTGDGDYTFALVGSTSDGVQFRARESALPPQLICRIGVNSESR
jgi:hypothetical protein